MPATDSGESHAYAFMGLPHSPQNFKACGNSALQWGTRTVSLSLCARFALTGCDWRLRYFFHFRQDPREFVLQVRLGPLIIVVRHFAQPVFELKIAQILVDGGFALVQVGETAKPVGRQADPAAGRTAERP